MFWKQHIYLAPRNLISRVCWHIEQGQQQIIENISPKQDPCDQ